MATRSQPGIASDVIHLSKATRIRREGGFVFKEAIGPGAPQRLARERDVLRRLRGIEGIAQLAGDPGHADREDRADGLDDPEAVAAGEPTEALCLTDGGTLTLGQRLEQGELPLPEVFAIACSLAATVAAMHRAGVVHRDLSPSNVLLPAGRAPMLVDFDRALTLEVLAPESAGLPGPPGPAEAGTLGYLAPEQTGRTGRSVDQRSDLYALGAIFYEMATGRPPFAATDALSLLHSHLVRAPEPPDVVNARVSHGLSKLILRLLAKVPDQRYQSAEGLLHDLRRLAAAPASPGESLIVLGTRDFGARLPAPSRVIGRQVELAVLREALHEAMRSPRRAVLIEGAPGTGKSALAQALKPLVHAAGGWFISGKFDQFQREGTMTGGVSLALRMLGRLLLAQPEDELARHRERLLAHLGRNAGLMAQLLPEFGLLLGAQPAPPVVEPRQAELQLHEATLALLAAIAAPQRPIVLLLDDLQWAGTLSLRAFGRVMADDALRGLLLVGAHRAPEPGDAHPLGAQLAQWALAPHPPRTLTVGNLGPDGLASLVGGMLRLPAAQAAPLARAVRAFTQGNPFDTVELVNALRRDGALTMGEGGWEWDDATIRRFVGRGNVVDLLSVRLARLPAESRTLLECAACLGSAVDPALLTVATGQPLEAVQAALRPPIDDGLLLAELPALPGAYHFRHDRVQQAALARLDDGARALRQLAMARRLAARPVFEAEAAQQYLACVHLLRDRAEQHLAARLLHGHAVRLAAGANYLLAERHLAAAQALLAAIDDPADAPLRVQVKIARHAALYSLGQLDELDATYAALRARAADPLAIVDAACLQMRSLDMRGRLRDAMAEGLHTLRLLGVEVPEGYAAADTPERLDELAGWIAADARLDAATRPRIADARLRAIARVLDRMVRSALVVFDRDAVVWLLLECQRLWAAHGPCPELVVCLGRLGAMLVSLRGDFRGAWAIAHHVRQVGEAMGWDPQADEARFVHATYASHWFEPLEETHRQVARAYAGVQAGGDLSFACYVHLVHFVTLVEIAQSTEVTLAELDAGLALCRRTGNMHAAALHASLRQTLRALAGHTQPPGAWDERQHNEAAFLARAGRLPYVGNSYAECRAMHALLMGDGPTLSRMADSGMALLENLAGHYITVYAHWFVAQARAWELQEDPGCVGAAHKLAELDRCRHWLALRAADQPHNFLHLARLVDAERAWAVGERWEAACAFDAAVAHSEAARRPWHHALILERAGRFHLRQGTVDQGRRLVARARAAYAAWKAPVKVAQLEAEHAFFAAMDVPADGAASAPPLQEAGGTTAASLDLLGVLRASQALGSETSLERLTARVTEVLAALGGATGVLLLSCENGAWSLLAPATGEAALPLAVAAERQLLPLSAFAYAERTHEPLVVDDATADDRFARDPYFAVLQAESRACSLLLLPIASQGVVRAMAILENRHGRAAFSAQRLDAVVMIAGQLAASLANVQLYEGLERRVEARTRELRETQAELVATARRAGRAEIANNVLHNVGNVLNSVNVSAGVAHRLVSQSRLPGVAQAAQLMGEHIADMGGFMAGDPRGRLLPGYLARLGDALEDERAQVLRELERLIRSVDHIKSVVATQQPHAGAASVLALERTGELVEEALRINADAVARRGIEVVRRFDDMPPVALDKPRVLQILVNLIGNAADAVQRAPAGRRRITLAAGMGRDGERDVLAISVRDEGEGIAPDNLTRIFAHGFTTKPTGHGFGLHSSAVAAVEMGGSLRAHSDGPGSGATFTLVLPVPLPVNVPVAESGPVPAVKEDAA